MEKQRAKFRHIREEKENVEMREIYWHIGIIDYFKSDYKYIPATKYADNIMGLMEMVIKKRGSDDTTQFESLVIDQ